MRRSPNGGSFNNFLSSVAAASATSIWAVGSYSPQASGGSVPSDTLIEHWDGVKWRIVAGPTGTNESHLNAVVHVPGTETAQAVGEMGGFALTEFRM